MAMFREGEGLFDFVLMDRHDEASFMENLRERFGRGRCIFTYIGEQIVSMNPFQRDKSLYTTEMMDSYVNRFMYEVQPHIYALADDTFRNMMATGKNQCVLITGESGAGKTEASKIFMAYIAHISKASNEAASIKDRLLESNPVLEAFGNAKTLRNDNSSRFGKYMELQFDLGGEPVGGKISQYLLEKGRVVTRGQGERSYHIFYQLLSQSDRCRELGLESNPSNYAYLKNSNCYTVSSINDSEEWDDVMNAMNVLGWEEDEIENVGRILAAILLIGNIEFNLDAALSKEKGTDAVVVKNTQVLGSVVDLLQCDREKLNNALITRNISTGVGKRATSISVPLDMKQAVFARDSLAKGLYSNLFNWTVDKINSKIAAGVTGGHCDVIIGVLDIYGFEIMEDNSFEQLCINYCNEKLQQLFIRNVLKAEQAEYEAEGIKWTKIDYFDNQPIISMIEGEKRAPGIYPLLDEACLVGEATPTDVVDKFTNAFKGNDAYILKTKQRSGAIFTIAHYAGEVSYNTEEFLFKNRDTFFPTLLAAMHSSSVALISELFPKQKEDDGRNKKKPLTAGFQFKKAVCALIDTLSQCQPHYIRCIKSNDDKRAFYMDEERVRHQVLYLNLVETTRVRGAGFCNRQHYTRFLWRYKMLSDSTWPIWRGSDKDGVQEILYSLGVDDSEYKLGKTKLFIKGAKTFMLVEARRQEELPKVAIQIQRVFKGYKTRKWFIAARDQLREEVKYKQAMAKIVRCWLSMKAREYIYSVIDVFGNAKSDANFGKGWKFPVPGDRYVDVDTTLKKLWLHWWAYMKVTSLKTKEEKELMRQKILCLDIFSGNKPWGCARRFKADYIADTPKAADYRQAIAVLFQEYGDTCVLFSANIPKINPKGKSQLRAIIVTDKSIFKYDPVKFQIKKEAIPLVKATGISVSKLPDTFVVVHFEAPVRDLIVDVGAPEERIERVSEFVSVIVKAHKDITDNDLPVSFNNTITFNNTREADPKTGALKKPGTDMTLCAGGRNPGKPSDTCVFEKAKKAKNAFNVFHP